MQGEDEEVELHVEQVQQLGPHLAILVCREGVDAIVKRTATEQRMAHEKNLSAWAGELVKGRKRAVVRARVVRREETLSKRGNRQTHVDEVRMVGWEEAEPEWFRSSRCDSDGPECDHGATEEDKAMRHALLAEWLEQHMGSLAGRRVADVGGGAGELSRMLAARGAVCVLVDPREASAAERDEEKRGERPVFERQRRAFGLSGEEEAGLLGQVALVVALHADQATEAALRFAVERGVSYAVVPCCVFPGEFRERRFEGRGVKKYSTFLRYLRTLDPRMCVSQLPFRGRNLCLYRFAE